MQEEKRSIRILILCLACLSIGSFIFYYINGLGLAYNDAKSHLDIGRRLVDGLNPGFAQLGGVWLPLPHLLMTPTIWNDFMWHSGLSGALQSMVAFVATGVLIFLFLKRLGVGMWGRMAGVLVFALNSNALYLQSTAMTELLLLGTMLAGCYELLLWHDNEKLLSLVKSAFWIMLATLIRYDGWFLFWFAVCLIFFHVMRKSGFKAVETTLAPFIILGGFGIGLWFFWNYMVFKDALYFAVGYYSAHEQQAQIEVTGALVTKNDFLLSLVAYLQAVIANANWFVAISASLGALLLWFDKKIKLSIRIATLTLLTPLLFNVVSLYLGYSVLFVPGLIGETWFNVRYGVMMLPTLAIFFGYLMQRLQAFKYLFIWILCLLSLVAVIKQESVVLQDALYGGSGYDVRGIGNWLHQHAANQHGYILVSLASHDQVVFASGLPMKRFVHQGTGYYWDLAIAHPNRYIRWIILRTNDDTDLTYRMLAENSSFREHYYKAASFSFADVYELKPEAIPLLQAFPVFYRD